MEKEYQRGNMKVLVITGMFVEQSRGRCGGGGGGYFCSVVRLLGECCGKQKSTGVQLTLNGRCVHQHKRGCS